MQLVFEFGSLDLAPVIDAIQRTIGKIHSEMRYLVNDSDEYTVTADSLASAAQKMKEGVVESISLHPESGLVRYALLTRPFFGGQSRSLYLGTIEYLGDDYKGIWSLLLTVTGLTLACLGFEEGVEINDDMLSPESFPWGEWPLVIGAMRAEPGFGSWDIRSGPEMRWFTGTAATIAKSRATRRAGNQSLDKIEKDDAHEKGLRPRRLDDGE